MNFKLKNNLFVFSILLLFSSCIGTDLVDGLVSADLSNLEIVEKELVLIIGESSTLTANYQDETGATASTSITWTSEDSNIATVSDAGQVTAISTGQTKVTASTSNGKTAETLITVIADENAIASISISSSANVIGIGESLQLSAIAKNGAGNTINGIVFSWSSSAPTIVQVEESTGLIESLSSGKADITVTAEGINSLPFNITVSGGDLSGDFVGQTGHNVSGTATLTQDNDGNNVIQLSENFSTQSGPGLMVYLGQSATSGTNGVSIGALKSNSGQQTYDIPSNIVVEDYPFVLIYCQPFSIVFGSAQLQ